MGARGGVVEADVRRLDELHPVLRRHFLVLRHMDVRTEALGVRPFLALELLLDVLVAGEHRAAGFGGWSVRHACREGGRHIRDASEGHLADAGRIFRIRPQRKEADRHGGAMHRAAAVRTDRTVDVPIVRANFGTNETTALVRVCVFRSARVHDEELECFVQHPAALVECLLLEAFRFFGFEIEWERHGRLQAEG